MDDKYTYARVVHGEFTLVDEPINFRTPETLELTYEDFRNLADRYPAPQEWYEE